MHFNYEQKEQQHDELNKQRFFRQMTHEIYSCLMQMTLEIQIMCKQIQQYVEEKRLTYKREQLKQEKEQLKREKEHQFKRKKE